MISGRCSHTYSPYVCDMLRNFFGFYMVPFPEGQMQQNCSFFRDICIKRICCGLYVEYHVDGLHYVVPACDNGT